MPDPIKFTLRNVEPGELTEKAASTEQDSVAAKLVQEIAKRSSGTAPLTQQVPTSQYDKDFVYGETPEVHFAQRQGKWAEAGNMMGQVVRNFVPGLVGMVASLDPRDFDAGFENDELLTPEQLKELDQKELEVGNSLSRWANEFKQNTNENVFPIYEQDPGKTLNVGSSEYWFKHGAGIVSSAAEFAVLGFGLGSLITKGLAATKWFSAIEAATGAVKLNQAGQALGVTSNAFLLNQAESILEATQVYDMEYKLNMEKVARGEMTEIEARHQAARAAGHTVNLNRMNILLNLTGVNAIMKGARGSRNLVSSLSIPQKLALEGGQEYLEETVNFYAGNRGHDKGEALRNNEEYKGATVEKFFSDALSAKGFEAGMMGALGGIGQTGIVESVNAIRGKTEEENERKQEQIAYFTEMDNYRKQNKLSNVKDSVVTGEAYKELLLTRKTLEKQLQDEHASGKGVSNDTIIGLRDVNRRLEIVQAYHNFQLGTTEYLEKAYQDIAALSPEDAAKNGFKGAELDPKSPAYYKTAAERTLTNLKRHEANYNKVESKYNSQDLFTRKSEIDAIKDHLGKLTEKESEAIAEAQEALNRLSESNPKLQGFSAALQAENLYNAGYESLVGDVNNPEQIAARKELIKAAQALPEVEVLKEFAAQKKKFKDDLKQKEEDYSNLSSKKHQNKIRQQFEDALKEREKKIAADKVKSDQNKQQAAANKIKAEELAQANALKFKEAVTKGEGAKIPDVHYEQLQQIVQKQIAKEGALTPEEEALVQQYNPVYTELLQILTPAAEGPAVKPNVLVHTDTDNALIDTIYINLKNQSQLPLSSTVNPTQPASTGNKLTSMVHNAVAWLARKHNKKGSTVEETEDVLNNELQDPTILDARTLKPGDDVVIKLDPNGLVEIADENGEFVKVPWEKVQWDYANDPDKLDDLAPIGIYRKGEDTPVGYVHVPKFLKDGSPDVLVEEQAKLRAVRKAARAAGGTGVASKITVRTLGHLFIGKDKQKAPVSVNLPDPDLEYVVFYGNLLASDKEVGGSKKKIVNEGKLTEGYTYVLLPVEKNVNPKETKYWAVPVKQNKLSETVINSIVKATEIYHKALAGTLTPEDIKIVEGIMEVQKNAKDDGNPLNFDIRTMKGIINYTELFIYNHWKYDIASAAKNTSLKDYFIHRLKTMPTDYYAHDFGSKGLFFGSGVAGPVADTGDLTAYMAEWRKHLSMRYQNTALRYLSNTSVRVPVIENGIVQDLAPGLTYKDYLKQHGWSTNVMGHNIGEPNATPNYVYTIQQTIEFDSTPFLPKQAAPPAASKTGSSLAAEQQKITDKDFTELARLARFHVENPKEPTTAGSLLSVYPELFKALTTIENARMEDLGEVSQVIDVQNKKYLEDKINGDHDAAVRALKTSAPVTPASAPVSSGVMPAFTKKLIRTMTPAKKAAAEAGDVAAQKEWIIEELSEFFDAVRSGRDADIADETIGLYRTAQNFPAVADELIPFIDTIAATYRSFPFKAAFAKWKAAKTKKGQAKGVTEAKLKKYIEELNAKLAKPLSKDATESAFDKAKMAALEQFEADEAKYDALDDISLTGPSTDVSNAFHAYEPPAVLKGNKAPEAVAPLLAEDDDYKGVTSIYTLPKSENFDRVMLRDLLKFWNDRILSVFEAAAAKNPDKAENVLLSEVFKELKLHAANGVYAPGMKGKFNQYITENWEAVQEITTLALKQDFKYKIKTVYLSKEEKDAIYSDEDGEEVVIENDDEYKSQHKEKWQILSQDPTTNLSPQIRRFFGTIKNSNKRYLLFPDQFQRHNPDELYKNLLAILADTPGDYAAKIEKLKALSAKDAEGNYLHPDFSYLEDVVYKLEGRAEDLERGIKALPAANDQIKAAFAVATSLDSVVMLHLFVNKYFSTSVGGMLFQGIVRNDNDNARVAVIKKHWEYDSYYSGVVKPYDGKDLRESRFIYDKEACKVLAAQFEKLLLDGTTFPSLKKNFAAPEVTPTEFEISEWLSAMGINLSPGTLQHLKTKGSVKSAGVKYSPYEQMFYTRKGEFYNLYRFIKQRATSETVDFLENLPISTDGAVHKLAKLEAKFNLTAHSSSHRSGSKLVSSYMEGKYLFDKALALGLVNKDEINHDVLEDLVKQSFAGKHSYDLRKLLEFDETTQTFKRDEDNKLIVRVDGEFYKNFKIAQTSLAVLLEKGVLRPKDLDVENLDAKQLEIVKTMMFMNNGVHTEKGRRAQMFYMTLGDTNDVILFEKVLPSVSYNAAGGIADTTLDMMFDYTVMPEIQRMLDYNNQNILDYDKGHQLFYFYPNLNLKSELFNVDEKTGIKTVRGDINTVPELKALVKAEIKSVLEHEIKLKLKEWDNVGFTERGLDGQVKTAKYLDEKYQAWVLERLPAGSTLTDVISYIAAEMSTTYMLHNVNNHQLFITDPATQFKAATEKVGEKVVKIPIEQDPIANVYSTFKNVTKRLKGEISPGRELAVAASDRYKLSVIADVKLPSKAIEAYEKLYGPDHPTVRAYKNITVADGVEFISFPDKLRFMRESAKLSPALLDKFDDLIEKYDNAIAAIKAGKDSSKYDFNLEDMNLLIQVDKPVMMGTRMDGNVETKLYVKSAAFTLIPQLVRGTELEKLMLFMDKHEIDRLPTLSALKQGAPSVVKSVFDAEGNFTGNKDFNPAVDIFSVPRKFLRLQQEVPLKEETIISRVSQASKQAFLNILHIKDFKFKGEEINGRDLYDIYMKNYKELYKASYESLLVSLGTVDELGKLSVSPEKLANIIRDEIIRGYSIHDLDAFGIEVLPGGKVTFKMPLWATVNAGKMEAFLNSIVANRVLKQKFNGYSFVLGSELGFNFRKPEEGKGVHTDFSTLPQDVKNRIVFTDKFNPEKGLLPAQLNNGYHQVVLPWKFKEELSKYMKGGKLNMENLDPELLKVFGMRIPNQGPNSTAAIEIVGFFPPGTGDTLVAPMDFVTQMGSDFDIDKLYVYMPNYKKESTGKLSLVDGDESSVEQLQNNILAIHLAINTNMNPDVQKLITAPQDTKELEDVVDEIETARRKRAVLEGGEVRLSPISESYQKQEFKASVVASTAIGSFALQNTFNALVQVMPVDKDFYSVKSWPTLDRPEIIYNQVQFGEDPSTKEHFRGNLRHQRTLNGKTWISTNIAMMISAAVDNNNNPLLGRFGINTVNISHANYLMQAGFSLRTIGAFLSQDILQEYVKQLEIYGERNWFKAVAAVTNQEQFAFEDDVFKGRGRGQEDADEILGEGDEFVDVKNQFYKFYNSSADELLQYLEEGPANLNYKKIQYALLLKYIDMDRAVGQVRKLQSLANVDSKGFGANMITSLITQEKIEELAEEGRIDITNAGAIFGEYKSVQDPTVKPYAEMLQDGWVKGINVYFRPTSIPGLAAAYGVFTNNKLWEEHFPYANKHVRESISAITKSMGGSIAALSDVDKFKRIFKEQKNFIMTDQEIFGRDPEAVRYALLYDFYTGEVDAEGKPVAHDSLVTILYRLKHDPAYAELFRTNLFLNNLYGDISTDALLPKTLMFRNPNSGEATNRDIYNDVLTLINEPVSLGIVRGKPYNTRNFIDELVLANSLSMATAPQMSMMKSIPTSLYTKAGINEKLRDYTWESLTQKIGGSFLSRFEIQYFQTQPTQATEVDLKVDITAPQYFITKETTEELEQYMMGATAEELIERQQVPSNMVKFTFAHKYENEDKLPHFLRTTINGQVTLWMLTDKKTQDYVRIPTLLNSGNSKTHEYNANVDLAYSLYQKNNPPGTEAAFTSVSQGTLIPKPKQKPIQERIDDGFKKKAEAKSPKTVKDVLKFYGIEGDVKDRDLTQAELGNMLSIMLSDNDLRKVPEAQQARELRGVATWLSDILVGPNKLFHVNFKLAELVNAPDDLPILGNLTHSPSGRLQVLIDVNQIDLTHGRKQFEKTVLHELVHGVTKFALLNGGSNIPEANVNAKRAHRNLKKLYDAYVRKFLTSKGTTYGQSYNDFLSMTNTEDKQAWKSMYYPAKSMDEFVVAVMTDEVFRAHLDTIIYNPETQETFLDRLRTIFDWVLKALGVDPNSTSGKAIKDIMWLSRSNSNLNKNKTALDASAIFTPFTLEQILAVRTKLPAGITNNTPPKLPTLPPVPPMSVSGVSSQETKKPFTPVDTGTKDPDMVQQTEEGQKKLDDFFKSMFPPADGPAPTNDLSIEPEKTVRLDSENLPSLFGKDKPMDIKPVYTAVFVDQDEVLHHFPQVHPNLHAHHSTIAFNPGTIANLPVGQTTPLKVTGRLTTDKVDVLLVENPLSTNPHPHITLSTARGVKPFESNAEIAANLKKVKPVSLLLGGTVGFFDGKKDITEFFVDDIISPDTDAMPAIIGGFTSMAAPAQKEKKQSISVRNTKSAHVIAEKRFEKNQLWKQEGELRQQIEKASGAKLARLHERRLKIRAKINALDKEITKIAEYTSLEHIIEHGEKDLQAILVQLLNMNTSDVTSAADVRDFEVLTLRVATWKNYKENFLTAEERAIPGYIEKFNNIFGLVEKAEEALANSKKDLMLNWSKGVLKKDLTKETLWQAIKDINQLSGLTLSLDNANHPLLQTIYEQMKWSEAATLEEIAAIREEITELFAKVKKKEHITGKNFSNFFEKDANGNITGGIVNSFSSVFKSAKQKLIQGMQEAEQQGDFYRKRKLKAKLDTFVRKNEIQFDLRKLKKLEGHEELFAKDNGALEKELRELLGNENYEAYLIKAEHQYDFYLTELNYYKDQLDLDPEVIADPAKKDTKLKDWISTHSVFNYWQYMSDNTSDKVQSSPSTFKGWEYSVSVPRKTNAKGQSLYNEQYLELQKDADVAALHRYVLHLTSKLRKYMPPNLLGEYDSNSLPAVQKGIIENLTTTGLKAAAVSLWDKMALGLTSQDTSSLLLGSDASGRSLTVKVGTLKSTIDRLVDNKTRAHLRKTGVVATPAEVEVFKQEASKEVQAEYSTDLKSLLATYTDALVTFHHKSRIEDLLKIGEQMFKSEVQEPMTSADGTPIMRVIIKGNLKPEFSSEPHLAHIGMLKNALDRFFEQAKPVEGRAPLKIYTEKEKEIKTSLQDELSKHTAELESHKLELEELEKNTTALTPEEAVEQAQKIRVLQDRMKILENNIAEVEKELNKMGEHVSLSGGVDSLIKYLVVKGLGWNFFGGVTNLMVGTMANTVEASSGRWFNENELMAGYKVALNATIKSGTFGAVAPQAAIKLARLMKQWDVLKSITSEHFKDPGFLEKGLDVVHWGQIYKTTEYINQAPILVGMMHRYKLTKLDGTESTLWEAFGKDGKWDTESFGEMEDIFPSEARYKFKSSIDKAISNTHGNYGKTGQIQAKNTSIGKLLTVFRNWMFEGFKNRWEGESTDYTDDVVRKGRYKSYRGSSLALAGAGAGTLLLPGVGTAIGGALGFYLGTKFKDNKRYKPEFANMSQFEELAETTKYLLRKLSMGLLFKGTTLNEHFTEVDARNLRKNMTELTLLIYVTMLTVMLRSLKDGEDDPEKKKWLNYFLNMGIRLGQDIGFYANPITTFVILRDPIPAVGLVTSTFNFVSAGAAYIADPASDKISNGPYADQSKLKRAASRTVPGWAVVTSTESLMNTELKKY